MSRILLVLLVLALVITTAGAEEDFSSPKATLKTLLTILRDGQLDHVAECFVQPQTEAEENMLLYGLGEDMYRPAVHSALVKKFGEMASPLDKVLASFDQQLAVVDSMEEKTDGISGGLAVKGLDKAGLSFVKVGDDWKIALVPGLMLRDIPQPRLATAKAVRVAYLATIKEIDQGKYKTADDAIEALEARRRAAHESGPQSKR